MQTNNRITINEAGFIRGLQRFGFTTSQCFAEIITNSIDARATSVVIEKIKII